MRIELSSHEIIETRACRELLFEMLLLSLELCSDGGQISRRLNNQLICLKLSLHIVIKPAAILFTD